MVMSMDNVSAVLAQLALIEQPVYSQGVLIIGIPGISHAYEEVPPALDVADMPAVINLPGAATDDISSLGNDTDLEARVYLVRVYVLPVANGAPGEGEKKTVSLIAAVKNYFRARPSLGGLMGVQRAFVIGDSGVTKLVFDDPSKPIWGFEVKLQVQQYIPIRYAAGE